MTDTRPPSPRRWHRRRVGQAALFVTLPGVLLGTTSMTAAYSAGWMTASGPTQVCRPVAVPAPARGSFSVTVLNATGRDGVAGRVAAGLRLRRFTVDRIGNAPESWYVRQPAVVHHGPAGLDQALLIATQLPGATLFADGRTGTSVDVVVGLGFAGKLTEQVPTRGEHGQGPPVTLTRPCP